MRANRWAAGLTALLFPVAFTACGWAAAAPVPSSAPEPAYAVGVRTLDLGRGTARPLPVTVWYPARPAATARADPVAGRPAPVPDLPVAAGRFPVVLFSHGLHSLPEWHAQLTTRWAAAGFVVAAPAYPHTNRRAPRFDRADVRRQPGDAWRAIQQVTRLDRVPGDRFAGHLDVTRIAAVGHSAGGFTTAGLFTPGHSGRLRAGIVIAGGMTGTFAGPSAALLFVHGGSDPVVPLATGRDAYRRVSWPRAFLTLTGQGHGEYLTPGRPGFQPAMRTMTYFLRWSLYRDAGARRSLATAARAPGVTEFTDQLG